MRRLTLLTSFLAIFLLSLCAAQEVHVFLGGALPLFARPEAWPSSALTVALTSATEAALSTSGTKAGRFTPNYRAEKLSASVSARLDSALLQVSSGRAQVDGPAAADSLLGALGADACGTSSGAGRVCVLLYAPGVEVSPRYEYAYAAGGGLGSVGLAARQRFLFVDVAARGGARQGEALAAASGDVVAYAREVVRLLGELFQGTEMRAFPAGGRVHFSVRAADVGAAGRAVAAFDKTNFENVVGAGLRAPPFDKAVSVDLDVLDVAEPAVEMALARAARGSGRAMFVVDEAALLGDLLPEHTEGGADVSIGGDVDASFAVHVPVYILSCGGVVGGAAVSERAVLVAGDGADVTARALVGVFQLLFGVAPQLSALIGSRARVPPPVVADVARRNVLAQALDWAETEVLQDARAVLAFDGLDAAAIPHGDDTPLGRHMASLRALVAAAEAEGKRAVLALDQRGVRKVVTRVEDSVREMRELLDADICGRSFAGELELGVGGRHVADGSGPGWGWAWGWVVGLVVGGIGGVFAGRKALGGAGLPSVAAEVERTGWFSTLSREFAGGDKSKLS